MYLPLLVCAYCLGDVLGGRLMTCENHRYVHFPDGESLLSIPFMPENILNGLTCPDCKVRIGGFHHPGCMYETCPRCEGRLVECGCTESHRD
jgi:hypothetical protein